MKPDNEWIKELKIGDKIAIDKSNPWNRNVYKRVSVVKITPTGRIKTSDGSQFYADGREIGGNSYRCQLRQLTPELLELIERKELLYKLELGKFVGLLSLERLKVLLEWQEELLKK